jgi:hypothetical protein
MGTALLAAAAIALGHAIQLKSGFYTPAALGWLTLSLSCATAGVAGPRGVRDSPTLLTVMLWAGVTWQLSQLAQAPPASYLDTRHLRPFHVWAAVEAVVVLAALVPVRRVQAVWFPIVVIIHAGMGLWVIHRSPSPFIDVITVHNAALRAIVHGHDPYAMTFANIYGPGSAFYSPGSERGARVLFGYPYPPLGLLLVVPGYLIGDYRYAELAMIVAAGITIGFAHPSQQARLAAALFLTTPRTFFVVEQGWSEPASVLLVSLTMFAMLRADRGPRWHAAAAILSGLATASKQYLVVALPLLWRLPPAFAPPRDRAWRLALGSVALATLPFVLWDPGAFVKDVVLLQLHEPFRGDALSYLVWVARNGWTIPSMWWTITAMVAAVGIALARGERSTAGFCAALSFTLLATFAFGRKAFCNYYFLVIGVLCCAVAAAAESPSPRPFGDSSVSR